MYSKIPIEIKPRETSVKITYTNAFDHDICLLLRERRAPTLASMQDVSLEVESNILAAQQLKGKSDRKKGKDEYVPSSSHSQSKIDEMTKTIESINSQLDKLKLEVKNPNKGMSEGYQRNFNQPYKKINQPSQILQKENLNQKISTPFPK
jgi:hypothetical protein